MINCPNCNHQNPDGALQCEACYTPLPALANCPHCNASIQADASFCGQCGSDLRDVDLSAGVTSAVSASEGHSKNNSEGNGEAVAGSTLETQNFLGQNGDPSMDMPDLIAPDPLVEPEPIGAESSASQLASQSANQPSTTAGTEISAVPGYGNAGTAPDVEAATAQGGGAGGAAQSSSEPLEAEATTGPFISEPPASEPLVFESPASEPVASEPLVFESPASEPVASEPMASAPTKPRRSAATQLQTTSVRLKQVQTNGLIEIPRGLSIVRIGKPNDHTPPDIDVSGFPDSEIVSRVHANIRVEGDAYYLEDVGSSNGTYINGLPLPVGNRHRLRPGDRIAFGKGDKVSFIFELVS